MPFVIDDAIATALRTLGRRESVTRCAILASAFQILLWRYATPPDLAILFETEARVVPETASLVGPFARTLALRTALQEDLPLATLRAQIERVLQEAERHELSGDRVIAAATPPGDIDRLGLFRVGMVFDPVNEQCESIVSVPPRATRQDLTLMITDGARLTARSSSGRSCFRGRRWNGCAIAGSSC